MGDSNTACKMWERVLSGAWSVHDVCVLSRALVAEGRASEGVCEFARLGVGGDHTSNEVRDFRRLHAKTFGVSLLAYILPLTLVSETGRGLVVEPTPVIALHEILYHLSLVGLLENVLMGEGTVTPFDYWSNFMKNTSDAEFHPLWNKPDLWSSTWPISFFADGVELTKNSQSEVVIYEASCPLSMYLSSLMSRLLIAVILADRITYAANKELCVFLGWTMEALLENKFPMLDHLKNPFPERSWRWTKRGEPILPGNMRAAFCAVTQDLKMRKWTHGMRNSWNSNAMCDMCCASKSFETLWYTSMSFTEGWARTLVSNTQYIANAGANVSHWSMIPGYTLGRTLQDWMHNVYLGIGRDATASCMYDLCKQGYFGGGSLDVQLKRMFRRYKCWCKKHKLAYTRKMFSPRLIGVNPLSPNAKFPECTKRIKAAYMKTLIHYLAFVTKNVLTYQKEADIDAPLRATMCWGLANTCYIFDHANLILSPQEITEATESGRAFLLGYVKLAELNQQRDCKMYNVRPKLHYVAHQIMLLQNGDNPGPNSNFLDEDFMGKIAKIARKQHRSVVIKRTIAVYIMSQRRWWRTHLDREKKR